MEKKGAVRVSCAREMRREVGLLLAMVSLLSAAKIVFAQKI
jgi:hypothetical protein